MNVRKQAAALLLCLSLAASLVACQRPGATEGQTGQQTEQALQTMFVPIFVLSVPILDITFSSLRRILKGKSPFTPDAEHIHHKLLKAGMTQNQTVLILASVAVLSGALASVIVSSSITKYFLYAVGIS